MPKPKNQNITKDYLQKLYDDGNSQLQIARLLNVTPTTICRWVKNLGVNAPRCSLAIFVSKEIEDKIWELYKTLCNREEIAKQLNITEWTVRKTIEGKCRGISKSRQLLCEKNTVALSAEQEQLILGSLLGDASLCRRRKDQYDFVVGHCLEQKDYLAYKANVLNSNVTSYIKDKDSYSCGKEFFKTNYNNKYELKKIYNLSFKDNRKTISKELVDKLEPLAIAIWYMDDGTSSFSKKSVVVRFSTLSFTKEECALLQDKLLKFNIHTTLQRHGDGYGWVIAIRQKSINDFMDLIEPYIVDCMKYKIKRRLCERNKEIGAENT